jgi:hypothetical protein
MVRVVFFTVLVVFSTVSSTVRETMQPMNVKKKMDRVNALNKRRTRIKNVLSLRAAILVIFPLDYRYFKSNRNATIGRKMHF